MFRKGLRTRVVLLAVLCSLGGFGPALAVESPASRALQGILEQVRQRHAEGIQSALVFDLDETLIDSTPRRLIALQVARESLCSAQSSERADPLACARTVGVRLEDFYGLRNSYSFGELWARLGLQDESLAGRTAWLKALERSTVQTYLAGRFEEFDREVQGASQFVSKAAQEGAAIFFVTSRFERLQGAETRRSLERLGFVRQGTSDRHKLVLRPDGESSLAFKQRVYREIAGTHGEAVIGVFENEPENLEALIQTFPKATAVFRDGAQLVDHPVPARAVHIPDFSL